jgi:hypothetical protein
MRANCKPKSAKRLSVAYLRRGCSCSLHKAWVNAPTVFTKRRICRITTHALTATIRGRRAVGISLVVFRLL